MSKAVKKIKKTVKKAVNKIKSVDPILGGNEEKAQAVPEPTTPAATPAQSVEVAKEEVDEDASKTASQKKAARARGKRGLSVARSSGTGLNI